MLFRSRSTPSGISSVSSINSSAPTRSSTNHSESMEAIWDNAAPAYSVSGISQEEGVTEVVFWDESEDTNPSTKKNSIKDRWSTFVGMWKRGKQEKDSSKYGIFTKNLARIRNQKADENGYDGSRCETSAQPASLVFLVILAQLMMDFLINLVSFRHIHQESSCCINRSGNKQHDLGCDPIVFHFCHS